MLLQKSQLSQEQFFAYELGATLVVQHPSGHIFFHLLSALNAEVHRTQYNVFLVSLIVGA